MAQNKRARLLKAISLEVLLVACLFLASLFVFAFIADEVVYEKENVFDNKVFAFLSSYTSPGLIKTMQVITFFGSSEFLLPAYIVLAGYFLFRKKYRNCVDISVIGLSSTGVMYVLKQVFHRNRPDLPIIKSLTTYSFPSGHTLSSFIFCSVLAYLIWNTNLRQITKLLYCFLLLCFSVTIGISRIVLKVHYATDVIASFCLGIAWVIMSFWLLEKINQRFNIWRANRLNKNF